MSTTCAKCHTPDGPAVVTSHAKFVIQPASYPGFIDANLKMLKEVSKTQYEGKSVLLLKPLGQQEHGGGAVLEESSDEYKALVELVERLGTEDSCAEPVKATIASLQLLDPPATLRKASLALASRLPTAEETAAVTKGGEAALDPAFDTLMKDPIFLTRLREIWNDFLLTDRSLAYGGAALNFMNDKDYPNVNYDDQDPNRYAANTAIAREPLDLLRRQERQAVHRHREGRLRGGQSVLREGLRRDGREVRRCDRRERVSRDPRHHRSRDRHPPRRDALDSLVPEPLADDGDQPQPRSRPPRLPVLPRD
jgi:hypothetical protein